MSDRTGSCLCGQVTYCVTGPLRDVLLCHCSQCRKTSGHYVAATSCPEDAIKVTGKVTWYRSSDAAQRGFCGTCGGNLFWRPDGQGRMGIFAGTFDAPTGLRTSAQICTGDKSDYFDLPEVPVRD